MLTIFVTVFHLGFAGATELPAPPNNGQITAGAEAAYFKSDANYDDGGSSSSLPGDFTQFLYKFGGAYDFGADWRFYGALDVSSVQASGATADNANSGLSDLHLGAQYWWREFSGIRLVPQADFTFPMAKVDESSSDAIISDGAMTLGAGSWALWEMHAFTPFAFLGFQYRDGGRSYLLPYNLGAQYTFGQRSFWVRGELRGYRTLIDDADTDNRTFRDTYLSGVNAGSYRYYAINPSLTELAFQAGTTFFENWEVYGGAAQSLEGKNAAQGPTVFAGVIFRGGADGGSSPAEPAFSPGERSEDQFTEPEIKYDERLFNESDVVARPKKKTPAKRAAPAKKPPRKTPVSVDKMLQETEKSLERRK